MILNKHHYLILINNHGLMITCDLSFLNIFVIILTSTCRFCHLLSVSALPQY